MTCAKKSLRPMERIENRNRVIRGKKVMIDADLADLYGVFTNALNQVVKRYSVRFPADFTYELTAEKKSEVITVYGHLAKLKYSRSQPSACAEQGARVIKAARTLGSGVKQ